MMVDQATTHWEDFKLRHQAAVDYAQSTLKILALANGGAILALLTFIGNHDREFGITGIFYSFVWFILGLSLAILAHGLAYFVQESYLNSAVNRLHDEHHQTINNTDERGDRLLLCAAICSLASLALFIVGALVALCAIT